MAETQCALYVYAELGKKHLGRLWTHLIEQGMHPTMYATEWIMTMFCRGFSFELATRVMDVYMYEGQKIVYRVALALIKNIERELLDADFESLMQIVRNIPTLTDANTVMDIAFKLPVKRDEIIRLQAQYEAMNGDSSKVIGSPIGVQLGKSGAAAAAAAQATAAAAAAALDTEAKKKKRGWLW